jgi:hypothetical protein
MKEVEITLSHINEKLIKQGMGIKFHVEVLKKKNAYHLFSTINNVINDTPTLTRKETTLSNLIFLLDDILETMEFLGY